MKRRQFLTATAVVGGGLLAGCLDDSDRITWMATTEDAVFADPVVVDGTVYTGTTGGDVIALDAGDGDEVWDTPYEIGTDDAPGHLRSAVSVSGDTLYYASTEFTRQVHAIDISSGDDVWENPVEMDFFEHAPTATAETVFAADQSGELASLDADTGTPAWSASQQLSDQPESAPVVVEGLVIVATRDGKLHAFDLDTGDPHWDEPITVGDTIVDGGLVVDDGTIYVGVLHDVEGIITAIDLETGDSVWDDPFSTMDYPGAHGAINTIPTVADGVIYATTDSAVFAVDADDGTLDWDAPFEPDTYARFTGAPTVAGEFVFVGSSRGLWAIEAETGEHTWEEPVETRGWIRTDPIVIDGSVYFGTEGNRVYAIDTDYDASSGDARVNLGISSHHDTWAQQ